VHYSTFAEPLLCAARFDVDSDTQYLNRLSPDTLLQLRRTSYPTVVQRIFG
jgi:hypothetical protein